MTSSTPILTTEKVTLKFGGLTAVEDVDLKAFSNEVLSIIGPNGAGKTSLFNAITGIYEPTSGQVLVSGSTVKKGYSSFLTLLLCSIFVGILITTLIFINSLWEQTINLHYVYGEAYDWSWIIKGILQTVTSEPTPFILCFTVTLIIAFFAIQKIEEDFLFCPPVCSQAGLARTFQNIRLFSSMTVFENVLLGMRSQQSPSIIGAFFPFLFEKNITQHDTIKVEALLKNVGLFEKRNQNASSLSYGERRRVEIARALATNPKVLLLDEPAAGLNPSEGKQLADLIQNIKNQNIAVVLIEHHMKVVMAISDRIIVLQNGKKIAEGTPAEIQNNQKVIDAYLGTSTDKEAHQS
jgi:branched-chain amino acid transport system ATP-binding protein